MRAPIALFLTILLLWSSASGEDRVHAEGGPSLCIASVDARLKSESTDAIWITLKNEGSLSPDLKREPCEKSEFNLTNLQSACEAKGHDAIDIEAVLQSRDDRIRILSGPQVAGSLSSGESRTIEFAAQAGEGAGVGIYPLDLVLTYTIQSSFEVSGDQKFPDIFFQYENATQILPIEAEVLEGPKIAVQEVKGAASPGESSQIRLAIANQGDMPAEGLTLHVVNQSPLSSPGGQKDLGNLSQGESLTLSLEIYAENGTAPGKYALPIEIGYISGRNAVSRELAAALEVKSSSLLERALLSPTMIAGLLVALAVAFAAWRKPWSRKSKKRKRLT